MKETVYMFVVKGADYAMLNVEDYIGKDVVVSDYMRKGSCGPYDDYEYIDIKVHELELGGDWELFDRIIQEEVIDYDRSKHVNYFLISHEEALRITKEIEEEKDEENTSSE